MLWNMHTETQSMISKWDKRFLRIAKEVASWSKDPRSQVGAIAVQSRRIVATGYNGFPRGLEDTEDRLTVRELKRRYVVHAEMNCIFNATYNGISLEGSTMYVYGLPVCSECAKGIIQSGVKRVVGSTDLEAGIPVQWMESYKQTMLMLDEVDIEFKLVDNMVLLEVD